MAELEQRVRSVRDRGPDNLRRVMEGLLANEQFTNNVTHIERFPPQQARFAPIPDSVGPLTRKALVAQGIDQLYTHQSSAIEHVMAGRHTVVVTPTASGKTLCYNVPVLTHLERDPSSKALYLFPTKALSRDQTAGLNRLIETIASDGGPDVSAFTYDGDTPSDQRRVIRGKAQVVVTNPDMMHAAMLPHHPRWETFLRNLKIVVIDELHTYRGLFGSHVANVFRRLQRLCRFYGANPTFVAASATIANPTELAEAIIGADKVELVDNNGAPSGERWMVFYNPPMKNKEQRVRQSALGAARQLMSRMMRDQVPTIAFAHSRTSVEVLLKSVRETLDEHRHLTRRIAGYRGGYLPKLRRSIEKGLRDGDLLGVVSTNALELGVDIGSLQACLMIGYPGTIASTWQQSGRAGRADPTKLAVAFLLAQSSAVDQFIIHNPGYFFGTSPEYARIDPDNLRVLVEHLKCAVFELPFSTRDTFGDVDLAEIQEVLGFLAEESGLLRLAEQRWHWAADAYPANTISLRSLAEENFLVIDLTHAPTVRYGKPSDGEVIAEVDFEAAHTSLHEGAIYQLDAKQYLVEHLDYDNHRAFVRRSHDDYYTLAISYDAIKVIDVFDQDEEVVQWLSGVGEVRVSRRYVGFKKIKFKTQENIGFGDIRLPDLEKHTTSWWLTFPSKSLEPILNEIAEEHGWSRPPSEAEVVMAMSGMTRVLHTVACVTLMCDRRDLGSTLGSRDARWWAHPGFAGLTLYSSDGHRRIPIGDTMAPDDEKPDLPDPGGSVKKDGVLHDPTVFLYDVFPGGVGFADAMFEQQEMLLSRATDLVTSCRCSAGCPSCVGPVVLAGERGKRLVAGLLAQTQRGLGGAT